MKKNSLKYLSMAILLCFAGNVMAQKKHFTPASSEGNVQCVKVSTKSLWRSSPTLSYERMLTPGRSSLEGTFGWFTKGESNALSGFLIKGGYKITLPIGAKSKALSQHGFLYSGFYIKPELTYVHSMREYACFAGNQGWNMQYDYRKYRENTTALMLMIGFQAAWEHFYLELSMGAGSYRSSHVFNQNWYYGFTGWGNGHGMCVYNTVKVGIPF